MRRSAPSRLALIALVTAILPAACRAIVGIESGDPVIDTSLADAGTGGGGADAGTGGGGADAGDHDADTMLCASYCNDVMAGCALTYAVYPSITDCLALCDYFDPGTKGDVEVDTIECRKGLTAKASAGDLTLCAGTGPGGNSGPGHSGCGTNCDSFCNLMAKVCPGSYVDVSTCLEACASVPDNQDYHVTPNLPDDYSIQCRLRYVSEAAVTEQVMNCMFAQGLGKCAP